MPNQLQHSQSPYLKQHAEDPVDWMPWGEEALTRARREDKPIFLSIGYSTCHWCHVMARESFRHPVIAEQLNRDFISVKVDREERPDIDHVYMEYVQALTGRGGWPLSVWLTPELKPFFGGIYFPPEDRGGRPGFASLLGMLTEAWNRQREAVQSEAERILGLLRENSAAVQAPEGPQLSLAEAMSKAFQAFRDTHDYQNGGFGQGTKFPQPGILSFLLSATREAKTLGAEASEQARGMVERSLWAMAQGGLRDHLGGGFHRYTVDGFWFLPHFEKMLYDQAQLAVLYFDAARLLGEPRFAQIAREVLSYLLRDMADPDGGFYAAEDADSHDFRRGGEEHREGAFYLWTSQELRSTLGEAYVDFAASYGVLEDGNIPAALDPSGEMQNLNHLSLRVPFAEEELPVPSGEVGLGESFGELKRRLLRQRSTRPRPLRDDKIIAGWNGLALSALARALHPSSGDDRSRDDCHDAALRCVARLRAELWDEDRRILHRSCVGSMRGAPGVCADYAFLIQGLLDLHESVGGLSLLLWAEQLQDSMHAQFADPKDGTWFDARASEDLVLRLKSEYDGAEPAPASVAVLNLLRLSALFGREAWKQQAERTWEALRPRWTMMPQALPWLLVAQRSAAWLPASKVVLTGDGASAAYRALLAETLPASHGRCPVLHLNPEDDDLDLFLQRVPAYAGLVAEHLSHGPRAHVCEPGACLPPIAEPGVLRQVLGRLC